MLKTPYELPEITAFIAELCNYTNSFFITEFFLSLIVNCAIKSILSSLKINLSLHVFYQIGCNKLKRTKPLSLV